MYDLFKIAVEKIKVDIWVFVLYMLNIYIFYMKDSDVEMVYNYVNQFEFLSKLLNYDFTFFMIDVIFFILIVYTISIPVASIFVLLNYPETKNSIKIAIKTLINKGNFLNDKSSDNFNNDISNFEKNLDEARNLIKKSYQLQELAKNNECTIQEFEEKTAKLNDEINAKITILEQCNKERKIQIKQFRVMSNRVSKFYSFEKTTSDLVLLSYITLLLFSIVYRYGIFAQKIEIVSISIILVGIFAQFFLVKYFSFLSNSLNYKSTSSIEDNK